MSSYRFLVLPIVASLFIASQALAAPIKAKPVKVDETFTSPGGVLCGKIKNSWEPGKLKKTLFLTLKEELRVAKAQLKASPSNKKLKKKVSTLKTKYAADKAVCAPGPGGGGNPTPTPSATPLPDHLSLDPYAGQVTAETVRYLTEKAGFGMSSKEQALVDLALNQGLPAAIAEFMRVKPEGATLANRVRDRFDGTLGNLGTQSRNNFSTAGFRQAALDFAVNTNNPFRENFRHFFLNLWTVNTDVLNNNTPNNPQIPLWWDYWELLGRVANAPNLPGQLIEVGRSPMMLIFLDNNLNLNGNVNENYARELMELFSIGTHRYDAASDQMLENYVEFRGEGNRVDGDIYRIATRLTGWRVSSLVGGDGLLYWRSVYSEADHDPAARVIFEGTPWAFTAQSDEDVVLGIFSHHPSAAQYIARELLEWYLTPNPPHLLVEELAKKIKAANFQLDGPMAELLGSKAFHHDNYKNTVAKTSFQVGVEMIRALGLVRDDIGDQAQEVGITITTRETDITRMGYPTTNPPTVFFFPESTWTSGQTMLDTVNFVANLIADNTAKNRLTDWSPQTILPTGEKTAREVIDYVAARMGVTLNQNQLDQFEYYMNNTYNGTTYTRRLYDNMLAQHRGDKAIYLYQQMMMQPQFLMK